MTRMTVTDFAIAGGTPTFESTLLVGRPHIPHRERFLKRLNTVLDSGIFSNGGPMCRDFEQRIADALGVRHVVATCNGTVALQIMAMACHLQGEVIVPSMTFIATAHALAWVGLTPVFADVDPVTHTLETASVARCITPQTSAILGVHAWGNLCEMDGLRNLADRYCLPLLFDASHAFGTSRNHLHGDRFGDAEAISFHATKAMHAVEGGAVITNDDQIAERCRLLRNFGITGLTQVDSMGTNGKMNELCAAAGLTCLEDFDELLAVNRHHLKLYREVVSDVPGLSMALPDGHHAVNGQYVVVQVSENAFGLCRDELVHILRAEGVFARAYFAPGCHNSAPYVGKAIHTPVPLPVTNNLLQTLLQLPTGESVSERHIRDIGDLLLDIQRHRAVLRRTIHLDKDVRRDAA